MFMFNRLFAWGPCVWRRPEEARISRLDEHLPDRHRRRIRRRVATTDIKESDSAYPDRNDIGVRIRFPGSRVAGFVATEFSDEDERNDGTLAAYFRDKPDGTPPQGLCMLNPTTKSWSGNAGLKGAPAHLEVQPG